jgi:hypothetical protein
VFEAVKIQNPLHKKSKMSDFVNLVINTRFLLLVIEAEEGGKRPRRGHYAAMPCGGLSRCYDFSPPVLQELSFRNSSKRIWAHSWQVLCQVALYDTVVSVKS